MKQDIENIIRTNLPEKKDGSLKIPQGNPIDGYSSNTEIEKGFNQALSQINTSLIADEVLKVVVEEIKELPSRCRKCEKIGTNPYGECECSYEDRNFVKKQDVINLLSNISPNKENKNNEG